MLPLEKYPGSSDLFDIDFSESLAPGDTITAALSVEYLPASLLGPDSLILGSMSINGTPTIYPDGYVAPPNTVIQVRVGGGSAPLNQPQRSYTIIVTASTAYGNTIVGRAPLSVLTLQPDNDLA